MPTTYSVNGVLTTQLAQCAMCDEFTMHDDADHCRACGAEWQIAWTPAPHARPDVAGRYRALGVDRDGDDVVQDYAGFTDRDTALRTAQRNFEAWGIEFVALMPLA